MPGWIKWILGMFSLLLLGAGTYFLLSQKKEATIFEREDVTSQEESAEDTFLTPISPETPTSSLFIEVLPEDCAQECSSFQTSPDQYAYCQNICGLSPDPTLSAPKPTDPNLSKDIERKNEAIRESNLSTCGEITDANLRKTCQTRVTEDLLE